MRAGRRVAALAVLPAIFGRDGGGPYRRTLANPILTWLGLISYGIFLWQFPVIIGLLDIGLVDGSGAWDFPLLLVATFAGTVVCATLSYYLLELPLMRSFRGPPAAPDGGDLSQAGRGSRQIATTSRHALQPVLAQLEVVGVITSARESAAAARVSKRSYSAGGATRDEPAQSQRIAAKQAVEALELLVDERALAGAPE